MLTSQSISANKFAVLISAYSPAGKWVISIISVRIDDNFRNFLRIPGTADIKSGYIISDFRCNDSQPPVENFHLAPSSVSPIRGVGIPAGFRLMT